MNLIKKIFGVVDKKETTPIQVFKSEKEMWDSKPTYPPAIKTEGNMWGEITTITWRQEDLMPELLCDHCNNQLTDLWKTYICNSQGVQNYWVGFCKKCNIPTKKQILEIASENEPF